MSDAEHAVAPVAATTGGPVFPATDGEKVMSLRYRGRCRVCGTRLEARTTAVYDRSLRAVRCLDCNPTVTGQNNLPQDTTTGSSDHVSSGPDCDQEGRGESLGETAPPSDCQDPDHPGELNRAGEPWAEGMNPTESRVPWDTGTAGRSARSEYERRKARDEQRLRERFGRFGGIAVALAPQRQSTKAWDLGARGEERLGSRLDGLNGPHLQVLHDRRIPGTRANIDHIVITKHRVWVVDAKRYTGRPDVRVSGGILRPTTRTLTVAGRDKTALITGVHRQRDQISRALGSQVAITEALCFIESDWPLFAQSFTVDDVLVLWPKKLEQILRHEADHDGGEVDIEAVITRLAHVFPSAG